MIYSQSITVPSYLCDTDDRLHPWAAVRLCQEVTEYHGNATGIGFRTLLAQRKAWVITQALYLVHRLPEAFEPITLETWARGNNGLIAFRDYRVKASESGELLLAGTSQWPLINLDTRRAIRLGDVVEGYDNHDELATPYSQLPKLRLPAMEDAEVVLRKEVGYAMLDHTQHVNNSEYIRMMWDYVRGAGLTLSQPFSIEVAYAHESRLGDELSLRHVAEGEVHYISIDNPRGNSIRARLAMLQ
ncbi:MAG: hypothetical protein IJU19_03940 [Bacteroidales bacterium]|nr:hypothetical protein [Bacteroidales bacterium]